MNSHLSFQVGVALAIFTAPYSAAYGQQTTATHHHHAAAEQADAGGASHGALATAEFRKAHRNELEHLNHVKKWAGEIAKAPANEQAGLAKEILKYFQEGLIPHAEWEEEHLYPLIDKLTESEKRPFTSTMRYEHKIVGRLIDELSEMAAKTQPDYVSFARKTDNLLGVVRAHFEKEDEVLLPFVDKSMTKEEFEKAVGGLDH